MAALGLGVSSAESRAGAGPLTVTPITWNVVGLAANNNNVSSGPFEFPSGVRVCNTGSSTVTGVSAAWTWAGGINAVSSNLWTSPADNTSQSLASLAGGACQDVYFDLQIKQVQANRGRAQQRTVTVTSGNAATASNTQYLYVESLVKQNRNTTKVLSGPGGCNITYTVCDPAVTNLYVGQTYAYKFYAQTATGYDELDAFALFPTFTQVLSTSTTYGTVTSPGPSTVDRIWSDACTWTGVTTSSSGACTTTGKAGGRLVTTYTVKATSAGSGSLPDLIYDHSGSSFHYNGDWSTSAPILASSFNVYYKLGAAVNGDGTVTSNVAGAQPAGGTATINCGSAGTICDAGYASGNVTLTATPGSGQQFSGWSGDGSCTGTSTTCIVTMNQSRSVVATFTGITHYPLYVTDYGSGAVTADSGAVNCGATCSGTYANGTVVTLTAAAASGWSFTGWGGDCAAAATSPTCQVTMSQARNVTATFTQNTYTLTLNATGTGAGDLCSNNSNQSNAGLCSPATEAVFLSCGSSPSTANYNDTTCTGTYPSGSSVTVYPMCNGGSAGTPCPGGSGPSTVSFGGYTGGTCTGNATTGCTLTMDQDRTVNANFVLGSAPDLTIAKTHAGNFVQGDTGKTYSLTVSNVGTLASYSGKTITVTDSAPVGLTITAMSGTGWTCTVLPTCTQVLGSNLAAGASLSPITVTVSVASNASTPLVNSAAVACSASCNDDTSNDSASDSTTILTPPDLTLSKQHSGNFTQGSTGTYDLTVSNSGGQPTSGAVTVTDTLPSGFTKSSFSGTGWDCSASTATTLTCIRSDTVAAGSSYPAIVAVVNVSASAVTATNTASVAGGGETNASNDSSSDPTTVVTALTVATAGNGSGNVVSDVGSINCGSGGSACTDTYDTSGGGTVVTLTETADAGSSFTGWSGACSGSASTCQVTMSQARSVTATFTLQTFTLQITTTGAGTGTVTSDVGGISCNQNAGTCSQTYDYGTVVTLSESPGGGSSFGGWSGGCTVVGSTCVATMTQAQSVSAQFDIGAQPDMTIVKSHAGNFTQGDLGDTYAITATNSGTGPTSGTVAVVDTLPSGLTATAISGGPTWNCSLATLTCTTSTVLAAGSSYPDITVTVDVSATASSSVTNSASVSGGGEVVTSNDSASDPTTIVQLPVLSIAKVHNPSGSWRQGDTGVASDYYTLTVSNGSASSVGPTNGTVSVTDTAPTGLTITAMSGSGWTCTTLPTCTRSDALARGAGYPAITVSVDVATNAAATVTNAASVSGGSCISSPCGSTTDDTPIAARYTLTTSTSGNGSGTVTSDVGSIDCGSGGSACSATYDDGTVVTLTAAADASSTFGGWSGACSGAASTCQVTMSQARSVTATFTLQQFGLDVSTAGNGSGSVTSDVGTIACSQNAGTCSDAYDYGSVVTLTPTPGTGSDFTGWSGACSGAASTCQVTMDQARAVTATFTLQQFDLGVSTAGNGSGSVTSDVGAIDCTSNTGTCGDTYDYSSVVTLTASAAIGSDFTGWSGDCSGTATTCQVTLDQARDVTAAFTLQTRDLTVATAGNGSGTVSSDIGAIDCAGNTGTCGDTYDYGTVVTLTANAAADSTFTGWSGNVGNCAPAATTCAVTMDQARSVTASFGRANLLVTKSHSGSFNQGDAGDQYTISVDNIGDGSTTQDVTVTEEPPASLTVTAMSGNGWTCAVATLTCTRSDVLVAGARYPDITVTVDVSPTAPASATNSAAVDGGGCAASPCSSSDDPTTIKSGATISGTVYQDINGQPGLANWTVYLDLNDNGTKDAGEPSATTAPDGAYSFGGLGPGTYHVREVTQAGWTCTGPVTCENDVTVTAAGAFSGNDFANLHTGQTASASGLVYNDLNADGTREPGEPGLQNWQVWIDVNGNGQLDPADATAQTTSNGGFSFTGVKPGTYTIYETAPNGWHCSQPTPCQYDQPFTAGANVTGLDFGNFAHGLVTGHKYEDANGDGIHQPSESPLGGFTIYVDYNDNGHRDAGEPSSVTLPDGYYGITNVAAGDWNVREVALASWTCSAPSGCPHQVTLAADAAAHGMDFLNEAPALLSGAVWDDLHADTVRDPEDRSLPGWIVYVDYNHDGVLDAGDISTTTDGQGQYAMGVTPGTWAVREVTQHLWVCDVPTPCAHTLTFTSGGMGTGDFGNYRLALVRGTMFNDLNRDGRQEAGDPGLGGWRIYVDYNDNGQWDAGEPFDVTSSGVSGARRLGLAATSSHGRPGHYAITGIRPGNWTIREVRKGGYACTLPFTCAYHQTFLENSVIDNRDFATYKPQLAGKATLQVPQACTRGPFAIRIRGREITRVVVTVAPGLHRTLKGKSSTQKSFALRLVSSRLAVGAHRVTARVYFTKESGTKPAVLRGVVYRCGKPSAAFTG